MTMPGMDKREVRLGAIIYGHGGAEAARLLTEFALTLMAEGVNLGGLVERSTPVAPGRSRLDLVDLRTGMAFPITQDLGAGSDACAIDPGAIAEASKVLRHEIAAGVELLVVSKFAGLEAAGRGLAAELFLAVSEGVPVLTSVSARYKEEWDRQTGGSACELAPDRDALMAWFEAIRMKGSKP